MYESSITTNLSLLLLLSTRKIPSVQKKAGMEAQAVGRQHIRAGLSDKDHGTTVRLQRTVLIFLRLKKADVQICPGSLIQGRYLGKAGRYMPG